MTKSTVPADLVAAPKAGTILSLQATPLFCRLDRHVRAHHQRSPGPHAIVLNTTFTSHAIVAAPVSMPSNTHGRTLLAANPNEDIDWTSAAPTSH